MTRTDPGAPRRRQWPIVAVFVGIVALQLAVTALSIELLSAVRAYVNGESLYSKGQKDAHEHLIAYIEYRHDDDYRAFERALGIPLGDRVAREALQQPRPDIEAARRGFLEGGNHAGDVDGMVRLFVWFEKLPFMAAAIATWTEGDALIARTHALGREAQRLVTAGADAAVLAPIRQQAREMNDRLSALEVRFSEQLGDASRKTQAMLIVVNAGLALLLLRGSVAVALLIEDQSRRHALFDWMQGAALLISAALAVGCLTPIAAVLAMVFHGLIWLAAGIDSIAVAGVLSLDALALALLGPGAYSVDSWRFGRRLLDLPPP